ncbi:hypothetical protein KR222_000032, partial [Zaprionus bogoriensis]
QHSGLYEIVVPSYGPDPITVACDAETRDGGWTIILRRQDGSEDFYRDWSDYKEGFGTIDGEHFLGLDIIHAMTNDQEQELLVLLEDFDGNIKYQTYDRFAIGDELESYVLRTLGNTNGTAQDDLSYHLNMKFSTKDRDNDLWEHNCAQHDNGAWWYHSCLKR